MPDLPSAAYVHAFEALPASTSCRLVPFDNASIHPGFAGDFFLVVSGTMPNMNMTVDLHPVVYIQQPEYWVWEVVGCVDGFVLPATAPFSVAKAIGGAMGTKGIDVVGDGQSLRLER